MSNEQFMRDHTEVSPFEASIQLEKVENHNFPYPVFRDSLSGNYYLQKDVVKPDTYPVDKFISLFCKGVLNTVDNIEINNKFYSRIVPADRMRSAEVVEMDVDLFLLMYLFGDPEHNMQVEPAVSEVDGNAVVVHHNLVTSTDGGRFYIFDYDHAAMNSFSSIINGDDERLMRRFNFSLGLVRRSAENTEKGESNNEFFRLLLEKLNTCLARVQSDGFVSAVAIKSKLLGHGINDWEEKLPGENDQEKEASLHQYLVKLISAGIQRLEQGR